MEEDRKISLKHFWAIKWTLVSAVIIASLLTGYLVGTHRMDFKIKVAEYSVRKEITEESKPLQLVASGVSFCYNQGNLYPVKIIPVKNRSLLPLFKAVQTEEF